jgi:uncharacterized coiled-coil protein SlyX
MAELTKQALKVENNTEFPNNNNGAITPSNLRGFNLDMIDSTVNQTQYTTDSGSWNQQIDSLEQFSGSTSSSISQLNVSSASQQVSINALNSFTASAVGLSTGSLLVTASASGNTITFTKGDASTFGVTVAGGSGDLTSLNAFTASAQISITNLNASSASQQVSINSLNASSASQQVSINNLNTTTASLLVETQNLELFSASALISISNLNASSASQQVSINSLNAATSSYVTETESGSFLITASFDNGTRNLTFTKGNNTTFNVNIPDVSGSAGNFVTTSSFNSYTASTDSSISQLNASSASQQISINNLNTTTASLLIETSNLETFSASALISISNLNSATSSLFTSASNALVTASVSGQTMTFTKGNGTTFNVTLPTGSGGGTIDTASFATTGSNTFRGTQTIQTGNLVMGNGFTIAAPSGDITNLSAGNTIQFITEPPAGPGGTNDIKFINRVSGSSIIFENTQGGVGNKIDLTGGEIRLFATAASGSNGEITIGSNTVRINASSTPIVAASVTASALLVNGNLTASLQQGYVWVGNASGVSTTVATSSFGGGGTINTGSFATTGSNSFNGDQNVTGSIRFSQQLQVGTANLGPSIQALDSGTPAGMTGLQVNAGESGSFTMRTLYGGTIASATMEAYNTFPNPNSGGKISAKAGGGIDLFGYGGDVILSGSNTTIQGLRYPNTDGTNGQVITTNGSGVLTFTTVSGGSGFPFTGDAVITGSLLVSGSATNDLTVIGNIMITGSNTSITNTNGVNGQYFGTAFGGNVGVYSPPNLTEIGLALDGAEWTTNWSNGPLLYVNNTPGDTYEGVFGFQDKTNFTDGRVTVLKPLVVSAAVSIGGNTTITGSLTISSSAVNDLTIFGRQLITGPTTGQTPQLIISSSDATNSIGRGNIAIVASGSFSPTVLISGSSHRNVIGQRVIETSKPGFDYPVFAYQYTAESSSFLYNYTENLSQTASYTVGVFDNGFTQDVELQLVTTIGTGIEFKDIRSDTGAYTTFLKIAPNGGTNPPLEFKRGMQVTGSLSIQSGSGMPSQIGTSLVTWNSATGQIGQATTATLISSSFSAGEFFSTNTLSGSAGVSASIALNNTAISNGVTIQNNSQIAVQNTGTYNIQFSAQCDAFDGADTIWIWFKKNGTNIEDSASKLIMQNNTANIMTVNIFDNAVPNDYYEVVWQNNAGAGKIISDAATGNIPRIPSVIVTVNQVK